MTAPKKPAVDPWGPWTTYVVAGVTRERRRNRKTGLTETRPVGGVTDVNPRPFTSKVGDIK